MLFDGKRLWLVDWEAAFQNDRYADLAVVANMIVTNESEERIYLQEYFGEPPDEYQRARFNLIRQLAHMFYAMAFLTLGSSGKPIDRSEPVPVYSDFQRRFWAREVSLADNQAKTVYGRGSLPTTLAKHAAGTFRRGLENRLGPKRNTLAECSIKGELSQSSELLINRSADC
jgi:hypothetical protein